MKTYEITSPDGHNADRDATDYKREVRQVSSGDHLQLHLAPGGGWAACARPHVT